MRHIVCSFAVLAALAGCAPPPTALGYRIRAAETQTEICRSEISRASYAGRPLNLVGPPATLTRPGLSAITINVVTGPGAKPEGWHCLFDAQGQLLSIAPGDAQARGDYLY
ncbi:MAG: hypothetical protein JWM77_2744 [Rhodospirillales bacterium]|jgi:hypothetical protein|nr:hypothetical protein [Rhodospirillales bacterium]